MQTWAQITDDFHRNWPIYVAMPFVAALIGWVTKVVAIRMMFRPHTFKGIGPMGWQGIIPKRAPQMVTVLCETLTPRLVNAQEIAERIDAAELAALIDRPLRAEVARITRKVLAEYQPTLWGVLPPLAQDFLVERIQRSAPDAIVAVVDGVVDRIDDVFDLQTMATKEFLDDPITLESMFRDVGRREFAFIRRSGLVFGFFIGLVQVAVWALTHNPWVMPLFGLFTGWFTDWAALRLIFYPREPKKYFGLVTWQGLFQQHRVPVAKEYGSLIATRVLTPDRLIRSICGGGDSADVVNVVAQVLETELRKELGDLNRYVDLELRELPLFRDLDLGALRIAGLSATGLVNGLLDVLSGPTRGVAGVGLDLTQIEPMCAAFASEAVDVLPDLLLGSAERYLVQTLDIEGTMSEKMAAMTPQEFEGVLRPAFRADEKTLIAVGAALGFLVGELQVLLVEHMTR
ncbi:MULTISPECIES: DUF445 family protein [Gordonia]|uniref:DUF445 domain-containing protein n=1 Tax=Gordonia TaxID=2053 RepID=UPI00199E08E2|nr:MULTISPECIES: DUF445 family protein [Gordonia]MBD0023192.1 DUF445 family protein [Gordonia sp. (in: high G+C Gram-positive bacteria)]